MPMLFGIMHGWDGPRYFTIVRKKTSISFRAIWAFLIRKSDRNSTAPYGKGKNRPPGFACVGTALQAGHAAPGLRLRSFDEKPRKSVLWENCRTPSRKRSLPGVAPAGPKSAPRTIRDTDESLVRSDGTLRNVIDRAQFSALAETTGANTSRARVAGERLFQNKEKSVLIFPAQRGSAELSDDPVTSCKNQRD